jgi:hypothetical protein
MPEHHHDFLPGIGKIVPFGKAPELAVGERKRNFNRACSVDASPWFFSKIEVWKEGDASAFQFMAEIDETFPQNVKRLQVKIRYTLKKKLLKRKLPDPGRGKWFAHGGGLNKKPLVAREKRDKGCTLW